MLALRLGQTDRQIGEVAPFLLRHAAGRQGHWRITAQGYDHPAAQSTKAYSVVYTEEEFSKLSRVVYHGLRNSTKPTSLHASLENVAQVLWPTGSPDHVAMRHVGVFVMMQYMTSDETAVRPLARWAMVAGVGIGLMVRSVADGWKLATIAGLSPVLLARLVSRGRAIPILERVGASQAAVAPNPGGSGPPPQAAPAPPPPPQGEPPPPGDAETDEGVRVEELNEEPPVIMDTPALPDDAATAAAASNDRRTMQVGDVVAVIGQAFNKDEPVNHMPVVGCLVGPCQVKPNVYAKTASNLKAAIEERITKKARKCQLSKKDKARIGGLVRQSMSCHRVRGVFSKRKIEAWAIENLDLELIRSGKWSVERFRASLEALYAREYPTYQFKAGIKPECMAEGKAPRMLIADGDDGQLMALAVVRCFEDLLFEHFERKSIKHMAKREAMDRVVKELSKKGAKAVEGDGSAWDTTCNVEIRALVENPVLRHICEVLCGLGVVPESWLREHSAACEQKTLRLFFKNKMESMSVTIDAIRRSGHRGTSCLNWWVNFTLWVSSIFAEPERFLDPDVRTGEDLTGQQRWWNGCFEGDDSLCTMKPPMEEGDRMSEIFLEFWRDAGFNMKIVFCTTRATFVGWHIGCTDGELNEHRCPELPRALANSGVSVSPQGVEAGRDGKLSVVKVLAAASALARASDFSGILPSVSQKYLDFAEECTTSDFEDREMSYRAFGEAGYKANDVREQVQARNLEVTPEKEQETLRALGYQATHDEIMTFREYIWSLEPAALVAYDSFRESLPPSWRAA
ncbi:RNA-dependent RNA polymerase [Beihai weivirus-like virus 4]|uniref:RNA-dependent RNA polymerase n=1 Tax=Beihai weivirus-like virus 4 TaxID=1922752 RepID=UPI0009094428|nr:RNA-dependent RNA polymerase [Beihai weivirus-like virus 4]APG78118.1 RNA-dependent RNA polymerase [Beihai weivirus-like virus 4]